MPIAEAVLTAVVEAVFALIVETSGATEWLRDKLGIDPIKRAYGRALERAISQLEMNHPHEYADLFNASFLALEGAPVLAQFLIRNGRPNPTALTDLWADSLGIHDPQRRAALLRKLEPVSADFLADLAHAMKREPALDLINDSRVFEQLAEDLRALRERLGATQSTSETRRRYLRWLIEQNLYLDPRGTFQTQRQVQVKLDEVYVSLQAQREDEPGSVDRKLLEQEFTELERRLAAMPIPGDRPGRWKGWGNM